ncbi:arylsulfatase [Aliiglaciecola lipolytica]|uniref:Sulfatase n=1 Tax=Aliiglaciecola lipolytica E3 TaxID=1127673 RepID=K6YIM2_9ALTE|nr:arylsulfatase [Aliiglaciecola lipolytica]GAC16458.1 sulfatase [Aliiglaciecola lipolytica E3]
MKTIFNPLNNTTKLLSAIAISLALAGCNESNSAQTEEPQAAKKPNVIYILVDDLGIGDIEPYGQELINTPNLQRMADQGMVFSQHYAGNPVCAPSRAALMTGQHSGHNQIRGNFELGGFADEEEFGQMPLQPGTETVAKLMKKAGYTTALIGKWGLGGPGSYGVPTKQGFDYFFGYLDQKQAHNHYPTHLWQNETWFPLNNEYLDPHKGLGKHDDPNDEASYEKFKRGDFAQQRLTDEALSYIDNKKDEPFFLYLSYAAPHAALQAPDEEIAKYNHFEDTPYDGVADGGYVPSFRPRATRAAMISHIDEGVGLVLDKLKKLGLDENTLVIFSSDNGPSFEGGADLEFFDSNAQYRGFKRDLYDGGIRMPTIARWPTKVPAGKVSDHVSAFWDVLPTLADLVEIEAPKNIDGISFLPTLLAEDGQQQHDSLYWEFHHWNGSHKQAVRIQAEKNADWKAIRFFDEKSKEGSPIELYNLTEDPQEQNNLAEQHPDLIAKAEALFESSRTRSFMDTWNFDYHAGKK